MQIQFGNCYSLSDCSGVQASMLQLQTVKFTVESLKFIGANFYGFLIFQMSVGHDYMDFFMIN